MYYPYTKKNIQLIGNVQRRATRILLELKGVSYGKLLESMKLPTMHYRRNRYDLIQLFKIVHGYEDIKSDKFCEFNDNAPVICNHAPPPRPGDSGGIAGLSTVILPFGCSSSGVDMPGF